MATEVPASVPEVAFNVTVPGVVVDRMMASALPLKADRDCALVRLVAGRISVVDAHDGARTVDREVDRVAGLRDEDALGIDDVHLDEGQVAPIRRDGGAVGLEHQARRGPGCLHLVARDDRAALRGLAPRACPSRTGPTTRGARWRRSIVFEPWDLPFRKSSTLSALV